MEKAEQNPYQHQSIQNLSIKSVSLHWLSTFQRRHLRIKKQNEIYWSVVLELKVSTRIFLVATVIDEKLKAFPMTMCIYIRIPNEIGDICQIDSNSYHNGINSIVLLSCCTTENDVIKKIFAWICQWQRINSSKQNNLSMLMIEDYFEYFIFEKNQK